MFLPPEPLGGRRTTCSPVSLLMFSSSSSDRASAISRLCLSRSLFSFCLFCPNGVKTQTAPLSPVSFCVCVVANIQQNSGEVRRNTVNFTAPNSFQGRINAPARCSTASAAMKLFKTSYYNTCRRLLLLLLLLPTGHFFSQTSLFGRELSVRSRTRSGCVTSHTEKQNKTNNIQIKIKN